MLHQLITDHKETILLLASASFVAFAFSIILLPFIIIRLPEDFFVKEPPRRATLSPVKLLLKLTKNLVGILLLLSGIVMIFIPGQGILTMLFGISLMDFPGKRRLEINIVRSPRVARSLNWLRKKADKPAFILPSKTEKPQ